MEAAHAPVEAVEARPWRPEDGPAPRVRTFPPGGRPLLAVRVEGEWRRCNAIARLDWPSGRTSYQVEIVLAPGGVQQTFVRSYWWDPRAMRAVRE